MACKKKGGKGKKIAAIALALAATAAYANPGTVEVCRLTGQGYWKPMYVPAYAVKDGDIVPIPSEGCPQPCTYNKDAWSYYNGELCDGEPIVGNGGGGNSPRSRASRAALTGIPSSQGTPT